MNDPGIAERYVPGMAELDGPGVVELLAGAPAAHRRVVAAQLGLAPAAPGEEIGAALRDPGCVARVIGALTPGARRLAAQAAFLDEGVAQQSWGGRVGASVAELERHGIVFTFRGTYALEHWVPLGAPSAARGCAGRAVCRSSRRRRARRRRPDAVAGSAAAARPRHRQPLGIPRALARARKGGRHRLPARRAEAVRRAAAVRAARPARRHGGTAPDLSARAAARRAAGPPARR